MSSRLGAVLLAVTLGAGMLAGCHKARDHEAADTTAQPVPVANPRPAVSSGHAPVLHLPASFRGTLGPENGTYRDTYLELRSDHSYLLEERFLGQDNDSHRDYTQGHFVQAGDRLRLEVMGEAPRQWRVKGSDRLRQLDGRGQPEGQDNNTLLYRSDPQLLPSGQMLLRGHYVFSDDVGFFRECESNHSWPVATAGAAQDLEQRYQAEAPGPDALVFVRMQAHLAHQPSRDGEHSEEALVVDEVLSVDRRSECQKP